LTSNNQFAGLEKKKTLIEKSTQKLVAEILAEMSSQQISLSAGDKSYCQSEDLGCKSRSGTHLPFCLP